VETRKRQLHFFLPPVVAISPAVRFVQTDSDICSFYRIYQDECHRRGQDPDQYFQLYRRAISSKNSSETRHLEAYQETCQSIPEGMLSQAMGRSFGAATQLFIFKKQFVAQLALTFFAGHMLFVAKRAPQNIFFSRSTGNIFHLAFVPEVSKDMGVLDAKEPVPFRLTRNMQTFVNPLWTEGPLHGAMTSVSRCLAHPQAQEHLRGFMHLLMRDELATLWRDKMDTRPKSHNATAQANVAAWLQWLTHFQPPSLTDKKQTSDDVHLKITQLLGAAVSPTNLAAMDPTWLPPF